MSESDKINARMGIYGGFSKETGLDAGIDRFETYQEPAVRPGDDPLLQFVVARIQEAEIEPRNEVLRVYDQAPAGPMAHRYAKHVRRDMVAFRKILVRHLEHHDLHDAVRAIAERWEDHHLFRDEWRLQ